MLTLNRDETPPPPLPGQALSMPDTCEQLSQVSVSHLSDMLATIHSLYWSMNVSSSFLGETIILSAEFENFTSRRLYPTAALYQRQYYYANERQKMRTVQLKKFQGKKE